VAYNACKCSLFAGPGSYCGLLTNLTAQYPADAALQSIMHSLLPYANKTATPDSSKLYFPLLNLFSYFRSFYSFCAGREIADCLSLYSPSPFNWLVCTESGRFATGYVPGSPGHPAELPIVSRTLSPEYYLNQCYKTYNTTSGPVLSRLNKYGGENLSYPRLTISTGQLDWYRTEGPLAEFLLDGSPNPRLKGNGTADSPEIVIQGGYHEWDFPGVFANQSIVVPKAVLSAKTTEVQTVKAWLKEWNQTRGFSFQ
jgi:hypothetical protein